MKLFTLHLQSLCFSNVFYFSITLILNIVMTDIYETSMLGPYRWLALVWVTFPSHSAHVPSFHILYYDSYVCFFLLFLTYCSRARGIPRA